MASPEANRRKLMDAAMVVLEAVHGQGWDDLPLWQKDQLRYTPEVALASYMAEFAEEFAKLRNRVEALEADSRDTRKELQAHGRAINEHLVEHSEA